MPVKRLFEYAVIRVVPMVEREEFLNVGVIIYCKDAKFLDALYIVNKERLSILCGHLDCDEVEEHLKSMKRICEGKENGGPISSLDPASRFRWLTATRSTVVQTSKVHPGFCLDPKEALQQLYEQLAL